MLMRIYILGGSGMVGTALIKHFSSAHEVFAPSHKAVDILDFVALNESINIFKPDVVINLVALCDMEQCEVYPARALQLHALGSANAALAADRIGATYVYVSSACVFDGESDSYSSLALPRPISTYGKSKAMGEQVARTVRNHIVLRTEWCFGGGPVDDTKFIGKIYRQIAAGHKIISAVGDKFGSLSYLPDFAVALDCLITSGRRGIFHVCCRGVATRFEIAQEFVRLLGVKVGVQKVDSSFFEREYHAPRPKGEVLVNDDIDGFTPRNWKEALAVYAKEFRRG
jgi:dTDP-4-dehydrorhamnose reductase